MTVRSDEVGTTWEYAEGVAFLPGEDPLWRNTPLPLTAYYNVLGVPLAVATNSPHIADLAYESFGYWGSPDADASGVALCLRVVVHTAPDPPPAGASLIMRAQDRYFFITAGASLGFADRKAGFAAAFVTPSLLTMPEMVRSRFLECLGMYLVCGRRRATLHAAGLLYGERGVLLTGLDGAGKSTLAYACVRARFRLLAEDIVFAEQQAEETLVWGDPRFLHLLPDALKFFPELMVAPQVQQLNGESKLRVQIATLQPAATVTQMPVWGVCSLERGKGTATRLVAADPAYLRCCLTCFKGDPPVDSAAMHSAVDRLLIGPVAHLEVGSDLEEAVTVLQSWIEGY